MIPYAILSGKLLLSDQKILEIRILDFSLDGFTFRISKNHHRLQETQTISLSFYQYKSADYSLVTLQQFSLLPEEENDFYQIYRVFTEDENYTSHARLLMKEYMQYIELKLNGDDSALSHILTGYPKEQEDIFPASLEEWRNDLFKKAESLMNEEFSSCFLLPEAELALTLESEALWKSFLELSPLDFSHVYFEHYHLSWHPLSKEPIRCVYFGSQYCLHLFPDSDLLLMLLDRALTLGMKPVLTFPPMKTNDTEKICDLLAELAEWWKKKKIEQKLSNPSFSDAPEKLELVINDWGMAKLLSEKAFEGCFSLTLGILLNKRKKDVRMPYKNGSEKQIAFLDRNGTDASFYRTYLNKEWGIQKYSYESCGYPYSIAPGAHILHLPFYQMNTSGHCTMYAACKRCDRGKQEFVSSCEKYCKDSAFLYPSFLPMIGSGNSLFGYDERILWDPDYFSSMTKGKIGRIVLSLL